MSDNTMGELQVNKDPESYMAVMTRAFAKQYGECSDEWTGDQDLRSFPSIIQGLLKLPPTASMLDIGCGNGADVAYFGEIYRSATGIDLWAHPMWQEITATTKNVSFRQGEFRSMRWRRRFDLVLDNGCFHHQHPDRSAGYLRVVREVLSKDGWFALSTFKNESASDRIDENGRLHRYFGDAELSLLLIGAGFVVVHAFDIYRKQKGEFYRLTLCSRAD